MGRLFLANMKGNHVLRAISVVVSKTMLGDFDDNELQPNFDAGPRSRLLVAAGFIKPSCDGFTKASGRSFDGDGYVKAEAESNKKKERTWRENHHH